jgi:hypothetical protein
MAKEGTAIIVKAWDCYRRPVQPKSKDAAIRQVEADSRRLIYQLWSARYTTKPSEVRARRCGRIAACDPFGTPDLNLVS